MAKVAVLFGDIKTAQAKTKQMVINKLTTKLPLKLVEICDWYKSEVASFKHVYFTGYEKVQEKLAPIILNEQPKINILIQGDLIRVHIEIFDDSVGGSLDRQTPTSIVHGKQKRSVQYPQLGWWRFFESGEFGTPYEKLETASRSWGSSDFGFVKTGPNEGLMAPLGTFVVTKSGRKVLVSKPHPGIYTIGFFEKTWLDLKEEFTKRIYNAVRGVLLE